jgi:hypothetical protein
VLTGISQGPGKQIGPLGASPPYAAVTLSLIAQLSEIPVALDTALADNSPVAVD